MMSIRNDILTEQQLKRLNEHKYSVSGDTLLDPYMQKFWKWTVQQLPTWFAPNLMTVLGLIINALTTLILICYSPDAKAVLPAWTLILFAIGLFIYQTLDACDGKQARRTGSTSTLGELFDHGCDSLSTVFVALSACVAVQLGEYPNLMFYQCIAASTLFYAAHWQTYVSAKLRFGKFDVTEAQFCVIAIHLVSAIFGVEIWSKQVPHLNCSLKVLSIIMIFLCEFNQFFGYVKIIFAGGVGKNGSTVAIEWLNCDLKIIPIVVSVISHFTILFKYLSIIFCGGVGKNGSTVAGTSVLSPCIPIAIVITSATIIFKKSTTDLVQQNPCLYLLTFGIIIAKITNKLVIAHMTKSEMQYLDSSFIGPFLLFLNQYFNTFLSEYLVLWLALIYSIIDIILYASSLCLQISSFLGIYIFTLKKRPPGKQTFKSNLNDDNQMTNERLETQSLLETNSSEEESESTNEHSNKYQSNGHTEKLNEDELSQVKCEDILNKQDDQPIESLAKNMIQFDDKLEKTSDNRYSNGLEVRKDFLTIDLGDESEFVPTGVEVNNISSSLKKDEMLNSLNISNISNILNVSKSNTPTKRANQREDRSAESLNNEAINVSDYSDEFEVFSKKEMDHHRTI